MSARRCGKLSEAELAFNRTVLDLSLIISLRADSWLKAVEQDPTVAAQLFAGIKSDQHEKYGWNNVVQQGLHKGLVERLDDVTLSLSIPMFEDYSIGARVLRVNLPAVALKSNQTIAATPSIGSRRRRGGVALTRLSTARTATATRRRASSRRRPSCACATAPTSPSSTSRCATTRSSTASASAT